MNEKQQLIQEIITALTNATPKVNYLNITLCEEKAQSEIEDFIVDFIKELEKLITPTEESSNE